MPVALLASVEITFTVSYGLSDVSDIRGDAKSLDTRHRKRCQVIFALSPTRPSNLMFIGPCIILIVE